MNIACCTFEPFVMPGSSGGFIRYLAFPVIICITVATAWLAYTPDRQAMLLPTIFLAILSVAIILERCFPFEPAWNRPWRESRQDGAFFLLAQPMAALADAVALTLGALAAIQFGNALGVDGWPAQWPVVVQIIFALLISELLPYLYHRISHEGADWLWRIHAVHHAPTRVYSLNFIRFHPFNSFASPFLMLLPLTLLGVPAQIVFVVATVQKVHAILAHTNFDFRLGPLNWVFSMAELHRWHHARDTRQANSNYGATLVVWDVLFGTRYLPKNDVRHVELGLSNPEQVSANFWVQLSGVFKRSPIK